MSELEIAIALTASSDRMAFDLIADLMEESGSPEEACRVVRNLRIVADQILDCIGRTKVQARQVQVMHIGTWRIWEQERIPGITSEDLRGDSHHLEYAIEHFDQCKAGLDALGVSLGFTVLDIMRTVNKNVLQIRFGND